ncbi:MAG TPA: ABC transporter permease [Candidatus Limnocylindrales bacterium]|nr:ABC transporter permease [Candidatus Limnocylindrales bacterium]
MTRALSDIRFAFRSLRRTPLFTAVAVASLALGIGANTAIFTLVDQLLLRLLPVSEPRELVMISSTGPHMGSNRGPRAASYPMYQDFQKQAKSFSYVFCRFDTPASISYNGSTERVRAELVSGNYFQALGVKAALGRVFTPQEDDRTYKGHPSVVLSYAYWTTRFAADPSVLGRKILIDDYPMTIVGVSAANFRGLDPATAEQIRIPIQMKPVLTPGWDDIGDRRSQWIQLFARMKAGVTIDQARASLQTLFTNILQDELTRPEMKDTTSYNRQRFLKRKVRVESAAIGYSDVRQTYRTALIALMCMVSLVLIIACFNVANLLIARGVSRQREMAVRLAIGASRTHLITQLLIESLLLAAAGGVTGIALAVLMVRALLGFLPTTTAQFTISATPDPRILGFNALIAGIAGLLFGLAPALQALKVNLWTTLKESTAAAGGAGGSARLRRSLVAAQVAFSFLLLAGAGLFVKTLENLKSANTGFESLSNLICFQTDPALSGYTLARVEDFYMRALEQIRAIPGVQSASFAAVPILQGGEWDSTMGVEGHVPKDGEDMQAFMNAVSPGYWKTMGIPLTAGRDFNEGDRGSKITVAIVNRDFATHFFGKASPIGRHVGFGTGPKAKQDMQIVGVVENTMYEGPREGVHRQAFVPYLQSSFPAAAAFYVRTSRDSNAVSAELRRRIASLDASMPVYQMRTVENQLDETLGTERLIATLSAAFGALATLLAALGLYGVMAFSVARRTREIGLRMALGANRGTVVWLVMREALALLAIGLAAGIPAAWFLSRLVASQLYSVKPQDLGAAAAALIILSLVAAAAGFLPARRASSIDPVIALRYE